MKSDRYNKIVIISLLAIAAASCAKPAEQPFANATPIPQPTEIPTPEPLKAEQVFSAFKAAQLPILHEVQYTEETDENRLLGRPGQYVGKISWTDKRVERPSKSNLNCTIEVFMNSEDLERRKAYVGAISQSGGPFLQYFYVHKNVLLRLDHDILPKDAAQYEAILKGL